MTAFTRSIVIAAVCAVLAGCGSYSARGTSGLDASEVARLDTSMPFLSPYIFVTAVDGQSRGLGAYDEYVLAPGRRIITILGNSQLGLPPRPTHIIFNAEAGAHYKLVYLPDGYPGGWSASIVQLPDRSPVEFEIMIARCEYSSFSGYDCPVDGL